ncbi:MAG: lipopolysaccharide biosynthesis protein [Deltaproteobacteria bacterium]|nr:MAG: lipopolysaccharide biosynthesis protein [Deltaproteobacteria bacterium]
MPATANQPTPSSGTPSHRILRKFAYLLSARWIREALVTVFFILLARKSAATYGEFMLAISLGAILVLVGEFGLNLPLVSLLTDKDRHPGTVLSQVMLIKSVLLVGALAGSLAFFQWQGYSRDLQLVMLAIGMGVALEALASTFFVAFQVEGRQDLEGRIKALGAGVGLGYGLLTLLLGASAQVVALFKIIETLVFLAAGAYLILRRIPLQRPSLKGVWAITQRGLIFALIEIAAIVYNKANLFFLQRYGGADGVAQYSVTNQTVDGVSGVVSGLLLQSVLFPVFVKLWKEDKDTAQVSSLAQKTAAWLLAAALPLMFFLAVESDRLIMLIYGSHYQDAVWLQKILVATIVCGFLHNLAALLMVSMRREKLLLVFYLSGLGINLLACGLLVPWQPLLGAALSIVITKVAVTSMTVSYCQWKLNLIPRKPFIQLLGAALAGFLAYFLTKSLLPRNLAELLALVPFFALSWRWWKER